uniref:hypothetical protein n=1 Tax=Trichocoleus desertorum TaxID=1481672 RepID=UPI0025B39868|nr:hypothetical protein [Trichocoleus desertorum]
MLTDHEHVQTEQSRIRRKDLVRSLTIGILLGVVGGLPIGWFAHRVYFQQRTAQVLLCRQNHIGQPEVELKSLCGSVY